MQESVLLTKNNLYVRWFLIQTLDCDLFLHFEKKQNNLKDKTISEFENKTIDELCYLFTGGLWLFNVTKIREMSQTNCDQMIELA